MDALPPGSRSIAVDDGYPRRFALAFTAFIAIRARPVATAGFLAAAVIMAIVGITTPNPLLIAIAVVILLLGVGGVGYLPYRAVSASTRRLLPPGARLRIGVDDRSLTLETGSTTSEIPLRDIDRIVPFGDFVFLRRLPQRVWLGIPAALADGTAPDNASDRDESLPEPPNPRGEAQPTPTAPRRPQESTFTVDVPWQRDYARHLLVRTVVLVLAIGIPACIVVTIALQLGMPSAGQAGGLPVAVGVTIALLVVILVVIGLRARSWVARRFPRGSVFRFAADDGGLTVGYQDANRTVAWSSLERVRQTGLMVELRLVGGSRVWLPRELVPQAELERIRARIAAARGEPRAG